MLISTMLRQYFMSLRIMDQWCNWTPSMSQHWERVAAEACTVAPPSPVAAKGGGWEGEGGGGGGGGGAAGDRSGWDAWTAQTIRRRQADAAGPVNDNEDGADGGADALAADLAEVDRALSIARRVCAKWCRLAGVSSRLCDELHEGEYT